jgi:hypothetical protein
VGVPGTGVLVRVGAGVFVRAGGFVGGNGVMVTMGVIGRSVGVRVGVREGDGVGEGVTGVFVRVGKGEPIAVGVLIAVGVFVGVA